MNLSSHFVRRDRAIGLTLFLWQGLGIHVRRIWKSIDMGNEMDSWDWIKC